MAPVRNVSMDITWTMSIIVIATHHIAVKWTPMGIALRVNRDIR